MVVLQHARRLEPTDRALVHVWLALVLAPVDDRAADGPVGLGVDAEEPLLDRRGGGDRGPDALDRRVDVNSAGDLVHGRWHGAAPILLHPSRMGARGWRTGPIGAAEHYRRMPILRTPG